MKNLIFTSLLMIPVLSQAECVPGREYIVFRHDGQYHRVHPSGNYVLFSSGDVKIIDISDRNSPKLINTPMRAETYPVEAAGGGWELLASPFDRGYMRYYHFKDVLAKEANAKDVYKDSLNNQYYHSSAELPGSTKDVKKVRTLLFGRIYRDYEMRRDAAGNFTNVTAGPPSQYLCQTFTQNGRVVKDISLNAEDRAKVDAYRKEYAEAQQKSAVIVEEFERLNAKDRSRMNSAQRAEFNTELQKVSDELGVANAATNLAEGKIAPYYYGSEFAKFNLASNVLNDKYNQATSAEEKNALQAEWTKLNNDMATFLGDLGEYIFSNPVLSKDGTLVAANSDKTIAVFRIGEEGRCEKIAETGFTGSKVSFSYPRAGKLPSITFTADNGPSNRQGSGVYTFDLNDKKTSFVSQAGEYSRYPGYTLDGRIIYNSNTSLQIVDPSQVNGTNAGTCIQKTGTLPPDTTEGTAGTSGAAQ